MISDRRRERDRAAKQGRVRLAIDRAAVPDVRQHRGWDAQALQQAFVPGLAVDVKEHRARRVGGVGHVQAAPAEAPQQEGIDRAEGHRAARGAGAQSRHVLQEPGREDGGG